MLSIWSMSKVLSFGKRLTCYSKKKALYYDHLQTKYFNNIVHSVHTVCVPNSP